MQLTPYIIILSVGLIATILLFFHPKKSLLIHPIEPEFSPNPFGCNGTTVRNHKKYAVVSMLTSTDEYVRGMKVLGASIQQQMADYSDDFDMLLLVIHNSIPDDGVLQDVTRVGGWTICDVPRIAPPDERRVFYRFKDQFTKLALFSWDEYERIVYLDGDTLVMGKFHELFKLPPEKPFAAVRDWNRGHWDEGFNMGVFSIKPSWTEFNRLLEQKNIMLDYELSMSEQGYLQALYRSNWTELEFKYNANVAIYLQNRQEPNFWRARERDIRIMHYTWEKPFARDRSGNSELEPLFEPWDKIAIKLQA